MKSQNFEILGQFRSKNGLFHKNPIFSKIRIGNVFPEAFISISKYSER